jgi:uncharacterized repeat protein (TIGR03803 family)
VFSFDGFNGSVPWNLIKGNDGNFYGTTEAAGGVPGTGEDGNIFCITPNGTFTNLFFFTGSDGAGPYAGLCLGTDGDFYGTTPMGGTNGNNGTIFKIAPDGTFTSLFSFNGNNGWEPLSSLVEGNDGNFYGTTSTTIFRITPGGTLTTLYSFTGGSDGTGPMGALVQATDGNFYGTTSRGGGTNAFNAHYGTIFRITPNGAFATLHSFQGGNEGRNSQAAMVQGPDGNLYGTTMNGGVTSLNTDHGTIFRLVIPPTVQPLALAGNQISLAWSVVPGQIYQVQYTSDLASGNWSNLTSQLTPSFNTLTVSDFISVTNQQRFYRIVEFPVAW